MIDLLPSGAEGAKASAAFQASADADPSYAQGALALVAARVAERDGAGAAKALARVPADADATEKGMLAAAVRWISGDAVGAAAALRETGESPTAAGDLALRVLGGLVATGYRRAALTLLESQPVDGPRLGLRVRARAALRDVEGLRKDLVTLSRLDARLAERLRERDPEVLATLGPAATTGAPEDRLPVRGCELLAIGGVGLLADFRDDPWPQATDEGASERSAREEAACRAAARPSAKVSGCGHDWLAAAGRSLFIGYVIDPCAGLSDRARWVGNASTSRRARAAARSTTSSHAVSAPRD